jgi:hypothetical protein
VPFVFAEPFEIFRINNGKHALCKGYAAERIAVAESAIDEHSKNQYAFNSSRDGNDEINFARSANRITNLGCRIKPFDSASG